MRVMDPSEMAQNVDQYTPQSDRSSQIDPCRSASNLTGTDLFQITGFKSPLINAIALPGLIGLAIWAINSPPPFLLAGFQTWVHEFGHATVAWMTGRRALPLPIGWTSVSEERTHFVYFGVLFLLVVFFVAGWKERKAWPIIIAVVLAPIQYYMTWHLPLVTARMWGAFSGIGGEFYLSTLFLVAFYFRLPEKFKWGACRYFFAFIGAVTFFDSFSLWREIQSGTESIPWGTMIHGEGDAGGDMNVLSYEFHWSNARIIGSYNRLAIGCLAVMIFAYLSFLIRSIFLYRENTVQGGRPAVLRH